MPYVQRNELGQVVCVSDEQQFPGQEFDANAVLYISPAQMAVQKLGLLAVAQVSRETLVARLTWLSGECANALQAAIKAAIDAEVDPETAPEVILQKANGVAVEAAINSLLNAFKDPRVVNSVNGETKQAIQIVYAEIVQAFKVAAPALHARMKKLDALT